jgi:hypothetical protein
MSQANPPHVGAMLEVRPVAARPVFGFQLKTQRPRIVVGNQLKTVFGSEMIEKLKNNGVAVSGRDIANVDHPFGRFDFWHGLSSPAYLPLFLIRQLANALVAPAQIPG